MLQSAMQQSAKISKLGFSSRHLSGLESNTTTQQIKNVPEKKVDCESESTISIGIINASSANKNESHIDSGNGFYPKVSLNLKNESGGTSDSKSTEITMKLGTNSNNESETNKNESKSAKWTLTLEQLAECLSHGAVDGMRQAAAVVDHQMKILFMKGAEAGSIQLDQVHTCALEGPLASNSCVVEGLVVMATTDSMPLVVETQQEGKRTLLIQGDVTPSYRQRGFKESVIAKSVLSTQEYMTSGEKDDNWLREVKDLLTQLGIQLLLVQGAVSESVQNWCGTHDIIVLSHVPYRVLAAIMSSAEVDQLTHLLLGTQDHVVHGVTVAPWSEDWLYRVTTGLVEQHVVVKHSGLSQTAILCHPAGSVVHLAEEQFWHCLRRLASVVQSGLVLPGGGETEAWCMQHLTQLADKERSNEQEYSGDDVYIPAVYQSLAKSFLRFKDIVSRNSFPTLCDPTAGDITESDASFSKFRQTIGSQCYVTASDIEDKTKNSDITENSDVTASDRDITTISDVTTTHSDVTGKSDVTNNSDVTLKLPVLDDCQSKVEAWRTALRTVCLLLQTDTYVMTGIDPCDGKVLAEFSGIL
ncbi:Bardet-Biedl syndrome 12 protein homolog [Lingula anatina]|uniref:Bardet-Biedl syndrome 12 protein homolog n=1 Tax=Lingula anatina TaxID=7574 RepID=A0A1S3GZI3_LINAN|nr:Bardet-Biedl syndrome 12 protein homolog [Lingula anatina]|eukprot:XP_013379158.1 Bardet-Biedl syndrome 12 protein homolog [Lingula anatina]